jgi:hypothetical protein
MENNFRQESRTAATQGPAYSNGNRNLFFPNAPTIYVEGDSDRIVLSTVLADHHSRNIQIPPRAEDVRKIKSHREWVAQAVSQGHTNRQYGGGPVLGIVDRDSGAQHIAAIENLYFYDDEDLEIMIINSKAFDTALRYIFVYEDALDMAEWLRNQILEAAKLLGNIRIFILTCQASLRLKQTPSINRVNLDGVFQSYSPVTLSEQAVLNSIVAQNASSFSGVDNREVWDFYKKFLETHRNLVYRRGHDAVEILRCFIKNSSRRVLGEKRNITHDALHDLLVRGFNWEHFKPTKIRKNMQQWARRNNLPTLFRLR